MEVPTTAGWANLRWFCDIYVTAGDDGVVLAAYERPSSNRAVPSRAATADALRAYDAKRREEEQMAQAEITATNRATNGATNGAG